VNSTCAKLVQELVDTRDFRLQKMGLNQNFVYSQLLVLIKSGKQGTSWCSQTRKLIWTTCHPWVEISWAI